MEKITSEQFQELVFKFSEDGTQEFVGDLPCIVDFYADWCAPCKLVAPALEQLSEEYKGKINVYKVNIEEENFLVEKFQIRSIPMLMFCPIGSEPQISNGALPKTAIQKVIEEVLINNK